MANDCLPALSATVVSENQLPNGYSLQLDIRVALGSSAVIIESFGGIGDNRDEAVADAVANFAANSLHTLLAAFYGQVDDQVMVEMWEIGAVVWRVNIGGYGISSSEGVNVVVVIKKYQLTWLHVMNGRGDADPLWKMFGGMEGNRLSIPLYVLVDNSGQLRYAANGGKDLCELRTRLATLLKSDRSKRKD